MSLYREAERERWAPGIWWLGVAVIEGIVLTWLLSTSVVEGAVVFAVCLTIILLAPIWSLFSSAGPKRVKELPAPDASYDEWYAYAKLFGKLLLFFESNPNLDAEMRKNLKSAHADLRDTLRAHPLRDDLIRVVNRIQNGPLTILWWYLWKANRDMIRTLSLDYEAANQNTADMQRSLGLFRKTTMAVASNMTQYCLPQLLARERLKCASECMRVALIMSPRYPNVSPIVITGLLVLEWINFSIPWDQKAVEKRVGDKIHDPNTQVEELSAEEAAPSAPADKDEIPLHRHSGHRKRRRRRSRHSKRHWKNWVPVRAARTFGNRVHYRLKAWWLYG